MLKAESRLQEIQIEKARSITFSIALLSVFIIAAVFLYNSRKQYKLKAELTEES